MGDMIVHAMIMEYVMQQLGSALVLMDNILERIVLVLIRDSQESIVTSLLKVSKAIS